MKWLIPMTIVMLVGSFVNLGGEPMISLCRSEERGLTHLEWLDSKHTFSFDRYYNPERMGFGVLRVINDDRVSAGAGFGMHPHQNMEIITYILDGALEHKDSMGNTSVIHPGDVQRMSAGTGVRHSEYNPSKEKEVHLLQIWILPDQKNLTPSYEQKHFADALKRGKFCLMASQEGKEGSVVLHQDVNMSVALMDGAEKATYSLAEGRQVWVHVARGSIMLNGQLLHAGDGVSVQDEGVLSFGDGKEAEILLFDMRS